MIGSRPRITRAPACRRACISFSPMMRLAGVAPRSKLLRIILDQYYCLAPMPKASAVGASYAVARELNSIGVNLNQLVHLANAARLVPVVRLEELIDRIEAKLEAL